MAVATKDRPEPLPPIPPDVQRRIEVLKLAGSHQLAEAMLQEWRPSSPS
jgi:hypothetical protein